MKRLLILLTLLMFTLPNCTNTSEDSENIFNNNENTTQDKTEEEEEQKEITLTSSKLTNVTIKTPPVKTEYTAGEIFAPAGLYLQATYTDTYSDGTQKENIEFIDCETEAVTFTGTDFAEAGTATVTVTYKGKNATFSVKVTEKPTFPTIGNYKITGEDIIISDFSDITVSGSSDAEFNISFLATKQTLLSLLEISNIAKAFPNANILDNEKIVYTLSEENLVSVTVSEDGNSAMPNEAYIKDMSNSIADISSSDSDNIENVKTIVLKGKNFNLSGNINLYATKIVNSGNASIEMDGVTFVNQTIYHFVDKSDAAKHEEITISDLIDTFNNLLPSGQTMSPVLESHPKVLYSAFSSLPQLALTLNMENVSADSKLKNQYINILKEYYDNDKAKLNDLDVIDARDFYVNGREGQAVDDIVGLYDENNNFNNPDDPKCTTPTTLPVYDVGFLHFSDTQGVGGFQNIVVTGDQTDDMSTSLDFTNVVFTGDVSGLHNNRTYKGVIHFKNEPMKDIYSEYALIKIDTPPTGKRANITGGIMDFRDIKDRLDDLTSDSDYDISNHLSLNGANKIARGYFKDERLKDYIEPRVETEAASFADTYFEPVDKEYMKTLQTVEETANENIEKLRDLFNNHPKSTEARQ